MMRYDKQMLLALVCAGAWLLAGACGGSSSSSGSDDDDGAAGSENGSGSGGADSGSSLVSDGSAGEFSIHLPDDTPVVELTDEDYIVVCEAAMDYVLDAALPAWCNTAGAIYALQQGADDPRADCIPIAMLCLSQLPTMVDCVPPEESCPATVGEMETCVNDLADTGEELDDTVPACTELTPDSTPPDAASILSPEQVGACAALEQQCPGIIPIPLDALPIPGAGGAAGTLPVGSGGTSAASAGAGG